MSSITCKKVKTHTSQGIVKNNKNEWQEDIYKYLNHKLFLFINILEKSGGVLTTHTTYYVIKLVSDL
jgi:hypothetical protein